MKGEMKMLIVTQDRAGLINLDNVLEVYYNTYPEDACCEPNTIRLLPVANLGWHVLDFQRPFPLGLLSPAVHSHELPVCKAFVGMIQQSAIGVAGSVQRGPEGMVGRPWLCSTTRQGAYTLNLGGSPNAH